MYGLYNDTPGLQHGCQFPDDIFKCIFGNKNMLISIAISLGFVPTVPINNIGSDNDLGSARGLAII